MKPGASTRDTLRAGARPGRHTHGDRGDRAERRRPRRRRRRVVD